MKCILSFRVAKHLLREGFRLIDVDKSHKYHNAVVFVFEETDALHTEIAKFDRKGK